MKAKRIFATILMLIIACAMVVSCKALAPNPTPLPTTLPTPTAAPTPTPPPLSPLEQKVRGLSDRELIGQMVMFGFDGTAKPDAAFINLVEQYKVGNTILFGWNIESFAQAKSLTTYLNSINPLGSEFPMFVAVDEEGGRVKRFAWSPSLKSALRLGQANDAKAAFAQFERVGKGLMACGVNVDLAPVLDISKSTGSLAEDGVTTLGPFLYAQKRVFSTNLSVATAMAQASIDGLQAGGALAFGKHYPGHWDSATDSHNNTPVITATRTAWDQFQGKMFVDAVNVGVDGMMVGHISYPNIDGQYIASQSKIFMTDILRGEMGFQGVIMSDDFRMAGLTKTATLEQASVRFVQAGGDLILMGRYANRQVRILEALYNALQTGELTRDRLEQSVVRILAAKQQVQP